MDSINYSVSGVKAQSLNAIQKIGLLVVGVGLSIMLLSFSGMDLSSGLYITLTMVSIFVGTIVFTYGTYRSQPAGIKNNGVYFRSLSSRGIVGWIVGVVLTLFYVVLYWYPQYIGYQTGPDGTNLGLVGLFDPLSFWLKGKAASQWFVYGTIYTLLITSLGIKFLVKYRHNRYHFIRTLVVIFSQLLLAYLIPEILDALNYNNAVNTSGEYLGWFDGDIKNTWPLDYDFFYGWHLDAMQQPAYKPVGLLYLFIGLAMFLIVTPLLTYYVGKRWYCSWVCGCGGLAETAGDSFRQLSSKKMSSWKFERWIIHLIMVWIFLMTAITLYGYLTDSYSFLGLDIYNYVQKPYGFLIGAAFSGVIGVGFYPLLGNRVWCRFGCPMAGYMGIIQRFKSRFRITTNGGQCISCGNCSTYCEQGIDVRAYAQKGQNIVRASCVGCGVCSAVCPRGVLKLENGPEEGRIKPDNPIVFGNDGFKIKE